MLPSGSPRCLSSHDNLLFRLFHRAWIVLKKPLHELVSLLGLEVPVAPHVSLAGIKSDSITLHWTRPDSQDSVVKYSIQVNGVNVGESSRLETAITVTGLRPDTYYNVRVVAVNASNFQAASSLVRLKTDARSAHGGQQLSSVPTDGDQVLDSSLGVLDCETSPSVHARGLSVEPATPPISVPPIVHEHCESQVPPRRPGQNSREADHAGVTETTLHSSCSPLPTKNYARELSESERTVQELTDKLEALGRESEDTQRQICREDEEYELTKATLVQERDQLRYTLKEREDTSTDLRKEVATLDRQNRSAQSRKAATEKSLHQKQDDRKKMDRDIVKWAQETAELKENIQKLQDEKAKLATKTEKKVSEARQQIHQSQNVVRTLEEDIRTKGVQIKRLEEERKRLQDNLDSVGTQTERDDESRWEQKLRDLQHNYTKAIHTLQQAQENRRQAQERLGWWTAQGMSGLNQTTNPQRIDYDAMTSKKNKQRRGRQRKSRSSTTSSTNNGSAYEDLRSTATSAREQASPSPMTSFFNSTSSTPRWHNTGQAARQHPDADQMTGGAQLSPSAGGLLPSDLLGDDDGLNDATTTRASGVHVYPAFGGNSIPGFGPAPQEIFAQDPNSPDSMGSRPASVFSSPRSSLNNLSLYHHGSDSLMDHDRLSLNSSASLNAVGSASNASVSSSKKFSNLFSLNLSRQRGKNVDAEPPPLGSLKGGQSQSFPRNTGESPGELDPIGTRRRRTSHSGGWTGPMASLNFLNRGSAGGTAVTTEGNSPAPVRSTTTRRRHFNMFSSKYDPLDPSKILGEPASPRPLSISSFDNPLPRPSSDSQPFGWPATGFSASRSGSIGADWSVPSGGRWSRSPSRRSSAHQGSSSSFLFSTDPNEIEVFQSSIPRENMPPAPIGTRPASLSDNISPKLNPAAPTFKTIFSRSDAKRAERAEKAERAAEEERDKERRRERDKEFESMEHVASLPANRRSHDDRSIRTEGSIAESYESLDRSISATASESTTPSGISAKDKETIFQKITRKSSSGKFNIPWKDKGSKFPKKTAEPSTPDEMEENPLSEGFTGKVVENSDASIGMGGGRSGKSWTSLIRKQRKGERVANGAIGASEMAGDTGDEGEALDG
ncbi:MAG: hypothetical protein M1833_003635 [Piccolia ochrophora]|nr:MAG: hypothetical protein M1833_003635 [Piccolia ochrophora]